MSDSSVFDIIVVGAGAAGCVLANRLTEDPARTVALVEAGPDYGPDSTSWPADLRNASSFFPDSHPWGFRHADRPAKRLIPLPRARVVGGSSAINACVWARGSAIDYDGWAALGNPGWSFAELLPYFQRSETDPFGGPYHGVDGPVPVFRAAETDLNPVDRAYIAAAKELGFSWFDDLNSDAEQHPGIGPAPKNVADGVRMSGAFTYLAPARSRPNLTIVPNALVDRVLVEHGRATGVLTADRRKVHGRHVVLSAGAYGSPAILLRSGIGPARDLNDLGIPIVADRPGVGAHLLDHPNLLFADGEDIAPYLVKPEFAPSGPSIVPLLLKARSRQIAEDIDIYLNYGCRYDEARDRWVMFFSINLEVAPSTGRVRLTSLDPNATLDIDHRYFAEPSDLEAHCDGAELTARLLSTPPLADMFDPLPGKTLVWRDRDELRLKVRDRVTTCFHPSGTCKMGPISDPEAVVDHAGRVYGVTGLRVADASVFPIIPRANIHSTVIAVAEKLADAIRCDLPA